MNIPAIFYIEVFQVATYILKRYKINTAINYYVREYVIFRI